MPINYDLLDEGDTLNAASLNSRITSLQTGVNDLTREDLGERALRSEHLPSIVRASDMTPGPMKVSNAPNAITAAYDNQLDVGVGGRNNVLAFGPGAGGDRVGLLSQVSRSQLQDPFLAQLPIAIYRLVPL